MGIFGVSEDLLQWHISIMKTKTVLVVVVVVAVVVVVVVVVRRDDGIRDESTSMQKIYRAQQVVMD